MTLPPEFLNRLRTMLSAEDYQRYCDSMKRPPERGIRLNLHKLLHLHPSPHQISYDRLTSEWQLEPLPESTFYENSEGKRFYRDFRINEDFLASNGIRPGHHPYHEAGLYYIQEPSAMQVVQHLQIRPYDRVLDLCASPGGKSTAAADLLSEEAGGYLVSNEYVPARARTLSSNIERMGIVNSLVLNEDTARIADRMPFCFSRVILDAPCSGEGMFRKNPDAITEWSVENVHLSAERQREIAGNAVRLLSPGGILSYSTCTFEPEEDEEISQYILSLDPDLKMIFEKKIFPFSGEGEGHYIAVFKREGEEIMNRRIPFHMLDRNISGHIFRVPSTLPEPELKTLRRGVLAETILKNRSEPEHALSHALSMDSQSEFPVLDLSSEDPRTEAYLHGMEISLKPEDEVTGKGFILVLCDGAALGFGKLSGQRVKNHYPKGLRFLTM